MLSVVSGALVGPQVENKRFFPRPIHKVASALDIATGVTMLVLGILSITSPHLGLNFSPAVQWSLLGAGAAYTSILFFVNILTLKNSLFPNAFLIPIKYVEPQATQHQ